ncbi:hypothetical protein IWW56_001537 [Coemansia sp. RSA 2131]|nr:hypothetical protein IWW56_001537 [Coemansia sp. RSA 2131]
MLRFGDTWRGAVNTLLKCEQCRKKLVEQLEAKEKSAAEIKCECESQIWGPARQLKESLGTGWPVGTTFQEWGIIGLLWPVFESYSDSYEFQMDSIYYDVKVNPLQHLKAFVQLNAILAQENMRFVQALPLRRSWVYAHVPLTTAILVRCIFGETYSPLRGGKKTIQSHINKYWGCAVDLQQEMFRSQKGHQFLGFAMTDGVSISAVRETKEEPAKTSTKRAHEEPQQHEQPVAQQARLSYQPQSYQPMPPLYQPQSYQLLSYQPPSYQLLSYQPQLYQPQPYQLLSYQPMPPSYQPLSYQPAQQQQPPPQQPPQQTQPVQRQRQQKADCEYIHDLSQAQLQSTAGRCVLVDPGRRDLLYMMHEESSVTSKNVYRYTRSQQRKETRVKKYRKILENEKTADVAAAERKLSAGSYIKPDLKLFEEYLVARADVAERLTRFYNRTMCNQRVGATMPEVPLHRKLRLSAYINRKRADQLLVNRLRKRFSQDAVFILGNWSASMTRFHEPIRGKGWRTLLKRAGFDVYLIDEYLTSKTCPNCEERISTFLNVPNPRPFRRTSRPIVKCHGLLGCTSQTCMEFFDTYEGGYLGQKKDESEGEKKGNVKRKLWNRDLAAVLNFRRILFSLRETGTVPLRFQRKTKTCKTTAPAAPAPHPN